MGRRPGSKNKPKTPVVEIPQTETQIPTEKQFTEASKKRGRPRKEKVEPTSSIPVDSVEKLEKPVNEPITDSPMELPPEPEKVLNTIPLKETPDTSPSNEKKKVKGASKSSKTYPLCDCCQKEIYSQPNRIDTNILSAQVADYHRESPRWVNLCSKCASELSSVVDNWLREHGCLTKFEVKQIEDGYPVEKEKVEENKNNLKSNKDLDDPDFVF